MSWTKVWPVLFCYHLFWCAHQKPVYIHVLTWQYHTILSDAIWFISAFAFHSENPPCGRTRQNNNNNNNNNRKINIQCSYMYIQPLYFQPLSSIRVTVSYVDMRFVTPLSPRSWFNVHVCTYSCCTFSYSLPLELQSALYRYAICNSPIPTIMIQCSCMYIQLLYFQLLSSVRITVSSVQVCDL